MQKPLEIKFRNMDPSPALEEVLRERAEKLEQFSADIISCRVMVEAPHKSQHKGNLYHLRIELAVPGKDIVVKRAPDDDHSHEDPYVAVRDAFNAVQRQLEEYARKRQGHVKTHETAPHGRVSVLEPEMDYGRLETADGRDIYFHRNSVADGRFDQLQIGSEVKFVEEAGDEGPQASSVTVL